MSDCANSPKKTTDLISFDSSTALESDNSLWILWNVRSALSSRSFDRNRFKASSETDFGLLARNVSRNVP